MDFKLCPACQVIHMAGTTCSGCSAPLSLVDERFFTGKEFGKYRVEGVLGMGGMGIVFKAVHTTLHKPVALKIILPGIQDDKFLKRFQREAQILAGLKHPHIVEVHDYDVSSLGVPYYVMEYLEGATLRARIAASPAGIPYPQFCGYARQMASGLAHAHRKGVIHRDLKPENVILASYEGGSVLKILDFGIAKLVEKSEERTTITATGIVVGTPQYLAPEQLLNRDLGPWTDEYAFALILAEMITGRNSREGKTLGEIITQEIQKPLPAGMFSGGEIPGHVGPALKRATDPDPHRRYPSVETLVEAVCGEGGEPVTLDPAVDMESIPTRQFDSRAPRTTARPRRSLLLPALAAAAALLVAAGVWLGWRLWRRPGPPPPSALLERGASVPTPPDAMRILCEQEDYLLLEAEAGGIYMMDASSATAMPGRVTLEEGETLLRAMDGGRLIIQKDDRLIQRDFHRQKDRDSVWAEGVPRAEFHRVGADGRHLASYTGGRILLDRIEEGKPVRVAAISAPERPRAMELSRDYLAWAGETRIHFHHLASGRAVFEGTFSENTISSIAILDRTGLAAVGGWFDRIYFFDLKAGHELPALAKAGITKSLLFLPDRPTLAIAGEGGLHLWSPGEGIRAAHTSPEIDYRSIALAGPGLLALDGKRRVLDRFAYRPFPVPPPVALGRKEIWAVEVSADGQTVYAGSSEGPLYRVRPGAGEAERFDLHTLGLTSIREVGDQLVTASDDKTIAVWNRSDMKVLWRSRAHDFLVNHLFYSPASGALWSTSSDGSIKRWSLPNLEETFSLKTAKRGNASLWMDEERGIGLLGTWAYRLTLLHRDGAGWAMGQSFPVPSKGIYSMAHLPGVDAVLMCGIEPAGLYLYDLARGVMHPLDDLGQFLIWTTPLDGRTALTVGRNVLVRCAMARADGRLSCTPSALFHTDFKVMGNAALMKPSGLLAIGNESGSLFLLPAADLPWKDLPSYPLDRVIEPLAE